MKGVLEAQEGASWLGGRVVGGSSTGEPAEDGSGGAVTTAAGGSMALGLVALVYLPRLRGTHDEQCFTAFTQEQFLQMPALLQRQQTSLSTRGSPPSYRRYLTSPICCEHMRSAI